MRKTVRAVVVLLLAVLLMEFPATAKIVVEPGPSELPTDVEYRDDEVFVPIWQNLTPAQVMEYYLVLYIPFLAIPIDLMYSTGIGIYLGYRNVSRRRLLDNEKRRQIFACIRDHPGISRGKICRMTGTSIGTTQYHILCLKRAGMIVTIKQGRMIGFFRNSDEFNTTERSLFLHLRNDTEQQILSLLTEDMTPSQSDIAEAIGIAGSSVSWHMKRLIADGIVVSYREGKKTKYLLTPAAAEILGIAQGEADHGTTQESGAVPG